METTTITKDNNYVTLINVFTVTPKRQEELMSVLIEATECVMRNIPGFISANLHKSLDGSKVVNYAQWESKEAFQAMLQNKQAQPHMEKAASIAKAEPLLYEVSHVDHK